MKNSARGELVEPCELCVSVVNTSSQETQNHQISNMNKRPHPILRQRGVALAGFIFG